MSRSLRQPHTAQRRTARRPRCVRCRWRPKHPKTQLVIIALWYEWVRFACRDSASCAARRANAERCEVPT